MLLNIRRRHFGVVRSNPGFPRGRSGDGRDSRRGPIDRPSRAPRRRARPARAPPRRITRGRALSRTRARRRGVRSTPATTSARSGSAGARPARVRRARRGPSRARGLDSFYGAPARRANPRKLRRVRERSPPDSPSDYPCGRPPRRGRDPPSTRRRRDPPDVSVETTPRSSPRNIIRGRASRRASAFVSPRGGAPRVLPRGRSEASRSRRPRPRTGRARAAVISPSSSRGPRGFARPRPARLLWQTTPGRSTRLARRARLGSACGLVGPRSERPRGPFRLIFAVAPSSRRAALGPLDLQGLDTSS